MASLNIIAKLTGFLSNPANRFHSLKSHGYLDRMSDEKFLKFAYKSLYGKPLDLNNPQLFSEKLQWLKLYNRKDEYTVMVDKYKVREYISDKLGKEYLIPLLGVWDSPEDIDFNELPQEFVMKCNHNSGKGMLICNDKSRLNLQQVKKDLQAGMDEDYYLQWREWPYKNVPHKIIAEKFMRDNSSQGALTDYKFFCFNGEPKFMYISHDLSANATTDFYDMDFKKMPIRMKDPNSNEVAEKPECFDKMRELAKVLSKDVPFLRVDFYYINHHIYFGELTFFHNAGFVNIQPKEWDAIIGAWIKLPVHP